MACEWYVCPSTKFFGSRNVKTGTDCFELGWDETVGDGVKESRAAVKVWEGSGVFGAV